MLGGLSGFTDMCRGELPDFRYNNQESPLMNGDV